MATVCVPVYKTWCKLTGSRLLGLFRSVMRFGLY